MFYMKHVVSTHINKDCQASKESKKVKYEPPAVRDTQSSQKTQTKHKTGNSSHLNKKCLNYFTTLLGLRKNMNKHKKTKQKQNNLNSSVYIMFVKNFNLCLWRFQWRFKKVLLLLNQFGQKKKKSDKTRTNGFDPLCFSHSAADILQQLWRKAYSDFMGVAELKVIKRLLRNHHECTTKQLKHIIRKQPQ